MLPVLCCAVMGRGAARACGRHSPEQSICSRSLSRAEHLHLQQGQRSQAGGTKHLRCVCACVCAPSMESLQFHRTGRIIIQTLRHPLKGSSELFPEAFEISLRFSWSSCPTNPKLSQLLNIHHRVKKKKSSLLLRGAPGTQDVSLLLPLPALSFTQGEKKKREKDKKPLPFSVSSAYSQQQSMPHTEGGGGWRSCDA